MTTKAMKNCNMHPTISKKALMKKILTAASFLLVATGVALTQQVRLCSAMLQSGEELRYKVKWNFLRLGTITVRAERVPSSEDTTLFKVSMTVESNPDLMIIKIREYNESLVSALDMMSKRYLGVFNSPNDGFETRYLYQENERQALYSKVDLESGKLLEADTLKNVPRYLEGPSMFFYARWMSRSKQIIRLPKVADGKLAHIEFDFTLGREYIEIDAIDEPVRTRKYKGFLSGGGGTSAGLSGDFMGWVSDDDDAVPIRAEMKVLLGSIHVELEKWSRPGWTLPIYVEIVKK